jgi:hypothetical protein
MVPFPVAIVGPLSDPGQQSRSLTRGATPLHPRFSANHKMRSVAAKIKA